MKHLCHAKNCKTEVPPIMLMCRKHWFMVSSSTQKLVWRHYRKGQCDDKAPSKEWLDAADKAIEEVQEKEKNALFV